MAQADAARPAVVLKDARALSALAALPAEFDRASAAAAWCAHGLSAAAGDELFAAFEEAGLFEAPDEDRESWWERSEWREARAYHEATRDYPFLQMDGAGALSADTARMRGYEQAGDRPSLYQRIGNGAATPLAGPPGGQTHDSWLASLSPDERRGAPGLGLMLDACFGERGRLRIADGTEALHKSIPSGGARHPTEVFVAVFDLPGIDAGIHHYEVEHHRLAEVRGGQQREAFAAAALDLFARFETPPSAALVFTSLVERAMWRYRDPRSFRAVLIDVGHAVAAYRHAAALLGWRTYAYQKLRDREMAELLGIDRFTQPPLYVGALFP